VSNVWTGNLEVVRGVEVRAILCSTTFFHIVVSLRGRSIVNGRRTLVPPSFCTNRVSSLKRLVWWHANRLSRCGMKKSRAVFAVRGFAFEIQHFLQIRLRGWPPREWTSTQRDGIHELEVDELNHSWFRKRP
jgi:hypothetical protein